MLVWFLSKLIFFNNKVRLKNKGLEKHLDNKTVMTLILNKFPYTAKVDWEEWFINEEEHKERFTALITWLEKRSKLLEKMIVTVPVP